MTAVRTNDENIASPIAVSIACLRFSSANLESPVGCVVLPMVEGGTAAVKGNVPPGFCGGAA